MNKIALLVALMATLMTGVAVVGAQDDDTGHPFGRGGRFGEAREHFCENNADARGCQSGNDSTTFGPRGWFGGGRLFGNLAEQLDMTPTEIREALQNGQTLADLLNDASMDIEVLMAERLAAFQARLDDAVANGRLTQERADNMLERFTERFDNFGTMREAI